MSNLTISVFEAVGGGLCVASGDGEKVYKRLSKALTKALEDGHQVVISFRNVELLTSAFLNSAIGQLYGQYSEADIRRALQVKDLQEEDIRLLKRVVENAKFYYENPQRYNRTHKQVREEYS